MPDPVLARALDALDLVVIEVLPGRKLQPFIPPPSWFKGLVHFSALPFLEHVLPEAEVLWDSTTEGNIGFGPFTVQNGDDELLLRVRALRIDGRPVLVIDRLLHEIDPRPALRKARAQALELEDLVRRSRETHAPASALVKAIDQLRASSLTPEQVSTVETMAQAVGQLEELTSTFPPPYKRGRQPRPGSRPTPRRDE